MTFYFLAFYLTIKSSLGIQFFPQPSCRRLPWVAKCLISKMFSRWWFQICLIFTPGEMIQFDWYCSKPPTSFDLCLKSCLSLKSKKLVCLFCRFDSSPSMNSYEIGGKGRMQNQTAGVLPGFETRHIQRWGVPLFPSCRCGTRRFWGFVMVEGWAALLAINGSYNPRNGLTNGFPGVI